ncbi:MAG: hypothetical protein U0166_11500 [Acidobacteriota bacterium]
MPLVKRLPGDAHRILVDGLEDEVGDEVAALGKAHLIAASEVGKDELVLRVVADALHQVVVVDDHDVQAQLPGAERGRGPARPSPDDQGVDDLSTHGTPR